MTKTPIPTENSKTKGQHTQTPPKTSITQQLRTDLGRSVGVTSNPTGVDMINMINLRLHFFIIMVTLINEQDNTMFWCFLSSLPQYISHHIHQQIFTSHQSH